MFDWRDNLDLARRLGRAPHGRTVSVRISEATERCAVGRAYYAAFCHALAHAVRHLGFVSTGGPADHGSLAAHFRARGMRRVAHLLGQLRARRNQCDYDDVVTSLSTMVRDSLQDAAEVIRRL